MKIGYDFLLLLAIVMFMAVYVNAQVDLFVSIVFFIYTSIPSLILYYLFYIKKIETNLRLILLVVFGYLWAALTSFFIKETYISIALFSGISIGVLASFLYHLNKGRKNSPKL